jgi:hypothetical protein
VTASVEVTDVPQPASSETSTTIVETVTVHGIPRHQPRLGG